MRYCIFLKLITFFKLKENNKYHLYSMFPNFVFINFPNLKR